MKVLLFVTGFRQVREYDYFNAFLARLTTLRGVCDVFIYCNNPEISSDIVASYKNLGQRNKRLYITSQNAGFVMGAVEAVSNGIEMGLFTGYDYVVHLHPDVFITAESGLLDTLNNNVANDYVFLVTKSEPDDGRFFSFDFFIFKPGLLTKNIFKDDLYTYDDSPEHYLHDMIAKNDIRFRLIKRFDNDNWFPRRVDEHLALYHEHDLALVEALLRRLPSPRRGPELDAAKWQRPVVALRPLPDVKRRG